MKRTISKRIFALALAVSMVSTGLSMSTVFAARGKEEPDKKVYDGSMVPVKIDTEAEEFRLKLTAKDYEWTGIYEQKKVEEEGQEPQIISTWNDKKMKTDELKVPDNTPLEAELIASDFESLTQVQIQSKGKDEPVSFDVDTKDHGLFEGYRNLTFTWKANEGDVLSFTTKKQDLPVQILDSVSNKGYYESVLCGDDCLEKHIRKNGHPDAENTTLTGDSILREGLEMAYGQDESAVEDRSAVPFTMSKVPSVGATYTGTTADITFTMTEPWPGHPNYMGVGVFSGRFTSGDLAGESYAGFNCYNHGLANPGINGWPGAPTTGSYSANCTSVNLAAGTATFNVTIDTGNATYQRVGGVAKIGVKPPKGGLSVQKVSGNTGITNNNSNYSLQGATYKIYNSAGTHVKTITTDASGVASTGNSDLDAGTYTVREATASAGYDLDTNTYTVNVAGGSTAAVNRVTSTEPPKTGTINLIKSSSNPDITNGNKCYSLKGAVYGVYTNAACTQKFGEITTTTDDGRGSIENLPFGTYWIKEIKAPKGYALDKTVYPNAQGVSIKPSSNNKVTTIEIRTKDKPLNDPAGIEISKIWDGDKTDTIPSLEGTQFTICYYDDFFTKDNLPDYDSYQSTAKRKWVIETTYEADLNKYMALLTNKWLVDELSDELYTDGGQVIMPLGTISIQETKAAPGYTLEGEFTDTHGNKFSATEKYVTQIQKRGDAVSIAGGNKYSSEDTPVYGSIKLKKLDSDGKTPLSQVQFEIRNEAGDYVTTKTTDSKGDVLFSDLYPDVYTITEVKTPDGHTLLKEPIVVKVPTYVTEADIQKYGIDKSKCIYDPKTQKYLIHDFTYEVTNHSTFSIPSTGGFTTWMTFVPLIAGLGILLSLGIFGFRYQKRRG